MSKCQNCKKTRLLSVSAKCSDLCSVSIGDYEHEGYLPDGFNIGSGDYVEFELCLDCGRIQGKFPIPEGQEQKELKLPVQEKEEYSTGFSIHNPVDRDSSTFNPKKIRTFEGTYDGKSWID